MNIYKRIISSILLFSSVLGCMVLSSSVSKEKADRNLKNDNIVLYDSQYCTVAHKINKYDVPSENYIPDGVYALKNISSKNWLSSDSGKQWNDYTIAEKEYSEAPSSAENPQRDGLFKISSHKELGTYVIRLMVNNKLTLGVSGNQVIPVTLPASDREVSPEQTFYINYNGDGYTIIPYAYGQQSIASTAQGSVIVSASNDNTAVWEMSKYSGANMYGVSVYSSELMKYGNICKGSQSTVYFTGWSTYTDMNTVYTKDIDNYNTVADLAFDPYTDSAIISSKNMGTFKMRLGTMHSDNKNFVSSFDISFYFSPHEGTYYIQNAGSEEYLSFNKTAVLNPTFFNNDTQKWLIEYVGELSGYVTIKSVSSSKYLGVDNRNSSSVRMYSGIGNYSIWKLDLSTTGNIIFKCKATEETESVLSSYPDTSYLHQKKYVNEKEMSSKDSTYDCSTDYIDEWYILTKVISFVNYFDSSFSPKMEKHISTANSFTNLVYARYFNIGLYMDGSSEYYHSSADDCSVGRCSDSCSPSCTEHHKNLTHISNGIYNSPRENDHIYILWTNRDNYMYCNEVDGHHLATSYMGMVIGEKTSLGIIKNRPVIHILRCNTENVDWVGYTLFSGMSLLLAHETAHTFQMEEVYDEGYSDIHSSEEKWNCIMGKLNPKSMISFYNSIQDNSAKPFCAECEAKLSELTKDISIEGNMD